MSINNIHVANEYTNNIPWHGMEYALRFFLAHLNKLAYSCLPTCPLTFECHCSKQIQFVNILHIADDPYVC